jgi:serine/threonine protein kinase
MEDRQHLPGKRSFRIPIELLDEFDEVWFTDSVPLIESFLGRVPAESQPDLLMELLAIEWEHRRKKGHHFSFREYLTRFPESAAWLQKHWREFSGSKDGESEIGKPEGSKKTQTDQEIENSRFRIDGIWARGGIGEVLLAWDRSLARQVAVKIIQARIADNEEVRRRFRREAEVIGKLEHPGIIPIYAYGYFENGEPYYAMRLVKDGETLESRIQKAHQISIDPESPTRSAENWERLSSPGVTLPGSLSIAETIDSSDSPTELVSLGEARRRKIRPVSPDREMSTIETRFLLEKFLSLTDAVAFAHSQGVIHRDIKPGNVILGPFGETFLVDWGLALVKNEILAPGEESSEFGSFGESTYRAGSTKPGRFIGTPSYCAPEQAMGLPCNDSCDIYSLGATLYHLMTGSPPRKDEPSNPQAIEAARANDFIPPRLVSRNLDKAMEALILKAMSTRPRDRYPSVKALSDDVRRWMADEPVSAWREPWSRWAGRLVRKHRKTAILTTVLLFLVALAGLSFREKYRELENSRILQAYQKQTFETQVAQEHYINLTHTAADLIETRSPGWSREFDEVSQSLDPIRRSHPDGIYPRFDRSKIARYSFSDLISTPKSQPINLAMTVSRIVMRPGHRQFAVAEFKLPRGTSTCRIQVVDTETRKILWKGSSRKFRLAVEQDGFRSIAFSPDGKWLAAGTRYGKAMLWKIGDLTDSDPDVDHDPDLSWTVRNGREVRKLQWSYTKDIGLRLISLYADDTVSVWRSEDLEEIAKKIQPDEVRRRATDSRYTRRCFGPADAPRDFR